MTHEQQPPSRPRSKRATLRARVTEELKLQVDAIAADRGHLPAAIVREAVHLYVTTHRAQLPATPEAQP